MVIQIELIVLDAGTYLLILFFGSHCLAPFLF